MTTMLGARNFIFQDTQRRRAPRVADEGPRIAADIDAYPESNVLKYANVAGTRGSSETSSAHHRPEHQHLRRPNGHPLNAF